MVVGFFLCNLIDIILCFLKWVVFLLCSISQSVSQTLIFLKLCIVCWKCYPLILWSVVILELQLPKFAREAVSYAESLLDSVMGGLEGLINILDSEGGYGSLDKKVLPLSLD